MLGSILIGVALVAATGAAISGCVAAVQWQQSAAAAGGGAAAALAADDAPPVTGCAGPGLGLVPEQGKRLTERAA
jgi:hypothetical protein